jgi:hypothetical protein
MSDEPMQRGPRQGSGGSQSSQDPSRRLTRLYLATAALVAVACFGWSELSHDPDCTEGPCPQDGPLILGAALEALLVLAYFAAMVVLAVKTHRAHTNRSERER